MPELRPRFPAGLRTTVAAIAAMVATGCDATPEVGPLEALVAAPAEEVVVRELGVGETLGEILSQELGFAVQADVLDAFRDQASPRRLRVGTQLVFRRRPDETPVAVEIALNRDESVHLSPGEAGWEGVTVQVPVVTDTLLLAGRIEQGQSLWTAIVDNDGLGEMPHNDRAELVDALDRVFQWQLDFSRQVRRGDSFRVAFERQLRPDGSMRDGTVVAAEFVNRDEPFRALFFDPNGDGRGSYFDLEGNSVRRAFLLKPLSFRRISSRFNPGRRHPILNTVRAHRGVDYAAASGTPIMATADGVVQHRGRLGGLGNAVVIAHANGFTTRYGHLRGFAGGIAVGSRVSQGDVIGYVGMTGLATGPHLHYEMIRNGRHVDPLAVDLPNGDPVPDDARDRWLEEMRPRVALLASVPQPRGVEVAAAIPVPGEAGVGETDGPASPPEAVDPTRHP
jgi:murein DD-endopeptidase MepM/ murein hydrolase activator NlpD